MAEYDEDDRQRDVQSMAAVALVAAALSGLKGGAAVLRRAELYEQHLVQRLPQVTVLPEQQCEREAPHRRHRFYTDLDDQAQCAGVRA